MSTERERMLQGELYYAFVPELNKARAHSALACAAFNNAPANIPRAERVTLQNKMLGIPPPTAEEIEADPDLSNYPYLCPPLTMDYGTNVSIAKGSFVNFNCTFLDTCQIKIGERVLVGPNVQFYAATHPVDPRIRNGVEGPESGKPITIEDDVWVCGSAIIVAGVTVGRGSVVGAGAVVTKDVEPYTVVGGNPAKILKKIDINGPMPDIRPPPTT